MELHNLKPAKGSIKSTKRVGRGEGSKKGGTSTRGHNGQARGIDIDKLTYVLNYDIPRNTKRLKHILVFLIFEYFMLHSFFNI